MTDSNQPKPTMPTGAADGGAGGENSGEAGGEKRRRRRRRRGGAGAGGGGADTAGSQRPATTDESSPRPPRPARTERPNPSPRAAQSGPAPRGDRDRKDAPTGRRDRSIQVSMPSVATAPIATDAELHLDDMGMSIPPPSEPWGIDDEPLRDVVLSADLPADDGQYLVGHVGAVGDTPVRNLARVTFASAGRTMACDVPNEAGRDAPSPGAAVTVRFDRGARIGVLRTDARHVRQREKPQGVVMGLATAADHAAEHDRMAIMAELLASAKAIAKQLRLAGKIYRLEGQPNQKLVVYYTCEDRLDMREFSHRFGAKTGARIELRQLGVRDEAKAVGGIGSCGLPLCCTTWLPDFVPVSIKMAKDQGLVLTSNKVSGQCGRLKCCLVYEQAGYTEMRKGLPRLGKRVLTSVGEGRVVEVDVLRQRIRVAYGPGDSQVHPASEVTAKFPSQPGVAGDRPKGAGAARDRGQAAPRTRAPSQELASLAHLGDVQEPDVDDDVDDDPEDVGDLPPTAPLTDDHDDESLDQA